MNKKTAPYMIALLSSTITIVNAHPNDFLSPSKKELLGLPSIASQEDDKKWDSLKNKIKDHFSSLFGQKTEAPVAAPTISTIPVYEPTPAEINAELGIYSYFNCVEPTPHCVSNEEPILLKHEEQPCVSNEEPVFNKKREPYEMTLSEIVYEHKGAIAVLTLGAIWIYKTITSRSKY